MKYERITTKGGDGTATIIKKLTLQDLIDRLVELENKIEGREFIPAAETAALRKAFEWALDRDDDVCGKCAYYRPPDLSEEYTSCLHEGKCVEGILKYFREHGDNK